MKNWMYQLYYDKDKMLAKYYDTGVFPYDMFDKSATPPKELKHDGLRFLLLHIFFILSSLIMWKMLSWFWANFGAASS